MDIYQEWGFASNPFETSALPPNNLGDNLLIGREEEVNKLLRRIFNSSQYTTIEGANGVGKTSLVNVAVYRAMMKFITSTSGQLLIPCNDRFQLTNRNAQDFEISVYRSLAQTLIDARARFEGVNWPETKAIEKWLNNPQLDSYQASLASLGGGITSETNTSEGFERSGFIDTVKGWLNQVFPDPSIGGIVCIIDNLELLQTSRQARAMLEEIRDGVLAIPGTRWVLCGALGIVRSVAASPRLDGYLHAPIEVKGFDETLAVDVYTSRSNAFSNSESTYLPLLAEDFELLYDILNNNIRSTLSYAGRYCMWAADHTLPSTEEEKKELFKTWLDIETHSTYDDARKQIRQRAWQLFNTVTEGEGAFSPGDYAIFDFNSAEALRPHVKDLEDNGLLVSSQDETDQRRKLIQVTPKGWAVAYAIRNPKK